MQTTNVTSWAMVAVGAALISGSGEALAPDGGLQSCVADAQSATQAEPALPLDPESNILLGARILQEYIYRTGTVEAGLQFYNGAFWDGSAQYAQKVMAERERLEIVLRSKGRI